jgi:DNA-binding transcriptional ArsR family regulator
MSSEKLAIPVEVEVSPRFEIFYALHKVFAPANALTDKWRRSARSRLGPRLESDARNVAPHPLMWAVLADCVLNAKVVTNFDDIIDAIETQSADGLRGTILAGVPDVAGANLATTFETLLRNPEDYRSQLVAVLRAFWTRVFAEDFGAIESELNRLGRQLRSAGANATAANAGARIGIPIAVDEKTGALAAGRAGFSVPLERVGRVLILPSAFNLSRWWTKRDGDRVDLFFPVSDGTITPNDAVAAHPVRAARTGNDEEIEPEVVFRALGDTTRYAIATILARSPMTPTDLARQLKVSKPTITHHVHSLRDAGLIIEGDDAGRLSLDRGKLEQLSKAAISALFASEGRLKLSKTRKKIR